ncbi:TrmH family RNA methyltransferase [Spirulina subsalsa]|uniref:TrmH family RNA methyltransferase n=1 Tax=Spirulina subsalsa TaxID=54311 RepID=UPI00030545BC|nr:RNA methyltransferase [Spirulina subsalsa]
MLITSLQNPLIKQLRKLQQSKYRRQENLCLLEGTNLVEMASQGGLPLQTVCCTPTWQGKHSRLWAVLEQGTARLEVVSEEVLRSLTTTVSPDGVLATLPRDQISPPPVAFPRLGVVLETLQDPGNLGTIIRTAAAIPSDGLWLSGDSVDFDNPKVLRASAGFIFQVPMARYGDLPQRVQAYRQQGGQVIATVPQGDLSYWDIDFQKHTLLLFGNEAAGLSEDLLAQSDLQVTIPLAVGVESLNVAIAAALLLYEAKRQTTKR